MCLRESPASFGPMGPVGQYTLVKISHPALRAQRSAENFLGRAVHVDVGGVERRDACVKGGVDARGRGVLRHLSAVRDPVAVGDLGDLQTAVAEESMIDHASEPTASAGTTQRGYWPRCT